MNRRTLGATALFLGLGVMSMTACGTTTHVSGQGSISGQGGTNAQSTTSSKHGTSNTVPNVVVTTAPVPAVTKTFKPVPVSTITIKPTGSGAPYFVSASLTCVVTDHESFPGEANIPLYQPELTWELKNATGMALSIDNPGLVGSYGTYDWHGSMILGAGCYTDEGTHTVVLYSTGGNGPQAQFTIHEKGTMTRPTPPPFAYPTNLPVPTPSPSAS